MKEVNYTWIRGGGSLWYVYEGEKMIAEVFREEDARRIVAALEIAQAVRVALS